MPSLNVADYIEECLESVLSQTLHGIEILCVDAGSTDGTWEIICNYAEKTAISELEIHVLKSNIKSYGYQVNMGIEQSRGEYLAILETDDYIEPHMYESLYEIAVSTGADYVKSDFDTFITNKEGKRFFKRNRAFTYDDTEKGTNKYGLRDKPGCDAETALRDYNIWKGIYRKSFIISNNIRLNESAGAAFQDIGFVQRVLAKANKGYYLDESLYRYRVDRDSSSIYSKNCLKNSYQEYKRLEEDRAFMEDISSNKAPFYLCMLNSFITEFNKVLIGVGGDITSEYVKPYIGWFLDTIGTAIRTKKLKTNKLTESYIKRFKEIERDTTKYAKSVSEKNERKEIINKLLDDIVSYSCPVFVFGAGNWGKEFVYEMKYRGKRNLFVCDNDCNKWGELLEGEKVLRPEECVEMCKNNNGKFVIANKKSSGVIRHQLNEECIDDDDIILWEF